MYKICIFLSVVINSIICDIKVKPIASQTWIHPYAPYWDQANGLLYMLDHMNGKIICYDEAQNQITTASLPMETPSFLIKLTQPEDEFLVSDHLSTAVIHWDRKSEVATKVRDTFSVEEDPKFVKNNWNVAKASPRHTFLGGTFRGSFCGNTSDASAGLYAYDKSNGVQQIDLPNLKASSGIVWNAKGDKVYHIAACQKNVREYDYDLNTGEISNGQIVFSYDKNHGDPVQSIPFGLTIDTDGFLYIAIYYGECVLKVNPTTRAIVQEIKIPALVVTAVEWGGKNLDKLFVCTASRAYDIHTGQVAQKEFAADSGKVFVVTGLGATGVPQNTLDI